MGRFDKRLNELEKKEGEIQFQLDRLDMEEKLEGSEKKDLRMERKIVSRELTDVKIRIRNLQRNKKKEVTLKSLNICEEKLVKVVTSNDATVKSIDAQDETFNPEAVKVNKTRPEMRIYPKVPLPHAQPFWDRVVRVGRQREKTSVRLTDWEGQFTGVEEEEKFGWQGRGGGKWAWPERNQDAREKEYRNWREEDGKGFCRLDYVLPVVKYPVKSSPPVVSSSGVKSPTSTHCKPSMKVLEEATVLTEQSCLKPSLPPTKVSLVSSPDQSLPPQCICHRPLHLVTCSSTSCGHSFYGRVATPCPVHPSDNYLMDHPTICPICKAVPLVEDRKQTSISTEEVLTKIKSKVNDQLVTKIKSIINQNRKESTKSLFAQGSKSCEKEAVRRGSLLQKRQLLNKSGPGKNQIGGEKKYFVSDQQEVKMQCEATQPVTTKMITVRAKLATDCGLASVVSSTSVVSSMAAAQPEALREKLRKRLILSKAGGGSGR